MLEEIHRLFDQMSREGQEAFLDFCRHLLRAKGIHVCYLCHRPAVYVVGDNVLKVCEECSRNFEKADLVKITPVHSEK